MDPDTLTLAPCIEYVDEWVTVTEKQIAAAMLGLLQQHSKLVEGKKQLQIPRVLDTLLVQQGGVPT